MDGEVADVDCLTGAPAIGRLSRRWKGSTSVTAMCSGNTFESKVTVIRLDDATGLMPIATVKIQDSLATTTAHYVIITCRKSRPWKAFHSRRMRKLCCRLFVISG